MFNSEDGSQAYLILQSKGFSAESIKPPTTFDNRLNPELSYYD